MPTKQVNLRIGEEALAWLDYLQMITHMSQSAIVADLIRVYYHAVVGEAFGGVPLEDLEAELVIRGGTIITVEEQKALTTVRNRLAGNDTPRRKR